jgi:hypothetical protein
MYNKVETRRSQPCFGDRDLCIGTEGDRHGKSCLGGSYRQTTGLDGLRVFIGADRFAIKEIEGFKL